MIGVNGTFSSSSSQISPPAASLVSGFRGGVELHSVGAVAGSKSVLVCLRERAHLHQPPFAIAMFSASISMSSSIVARVSMLWISLRVKYSRGFSLIRVLNIGGDIRILLSNAAGRGDLGQRKSDVGFETYSLLGGAENHGLHWKRPIESLRVCRGNWSWVDLCLKLKRGRNKQQRSSQNRV